MLVNGDEDVYILGDSDGELDHLVRQAEVFGESAQHLFDRIGVAHGWAVADIGCGALGVLALLADRVGPTGSVTGVDRELRMLTTAQASLRQRGHDRVRLVRADAQDTGLPRASLDLVHTRTLLINHPEPDRVLSEMMACARPGGWVAAQEPDTAAWMCEPSCPAWDRLLELFSAHYRARGCDPRIGRRLPALFHALGVDDVVIDVRPTAVTRPGDWYHTQLPTFIGLMRDSMVALGLCDDGELDELVAELREHLDRPGTLTFCPLWQVWARRGHESALVTNAAAGRQPHDANTELLR